MSCGEGSVVDVGGRVVRVFYKTCEGVRHRNKGKTRTIGFSGKQGRNSQFRNGQKTLV